MSQYLHLGFDGLCVFFFSPFLYNQMIVMSQSITMLRAGGFSSTTDDSILTYTVYLHVPAFHC